MPQLKIWLFLVTLPVIISCTPHSEAPATPVQMEGTSDSGGGNGVENKVYERYIIDPAQLPAYREVIAPQINRLIELIPPNGRPNFHKYFKKWMLYKTWYVAPIGLNTISKDVIGVSFSNNHTEQLAIQTKRSVWINDGHFNKMSTIDQSALLLHEMVMSLYYLKFKSWNDVCAEKLLSEVECTQLDRDVLPELFPGSDPRPFSSDDYENIRAVVGSFLGEIQFRSIDDIDQVLISNHFDRRFTPGMGLQGSTIGVQKTEFIYKTQDLPVQDFLQAIESAELLNRTPDTCQSERFKTTFACHFSTQRSASEETSTSISQMLFSAYSKDQRYKMDFANSVLLIKSISSSSIEFVAQKLRINYFYLDTFPSPTRSSMGAKFRSGVIVTEQDLRQTNSAHMLLGLISIPGVVTGVNTRDSVGCTYARPNPTSYEDDIIFTYFSTLSDFQKSLLRFRSKTLPPATICR